MGRLNVVCPLMFVVAALNQMDGNSRQQNACAAGHDQRADMNTAAST